MKRFYVRIFVYFSTLNPLLVKSQTLTLDEGFGSSGTVFQTFDGYNCSIVGMHQIGGGKFLTYAVRNESNLFQSEGFILQQYNADGSLDPNFGENGTVLVANIEHDGTPNKCILVQENGKILVTGRGDDVNEGDFVTYRFNPNGTFDTTFGTNGVVVTNIFNLEDESKAILEQPDGKILVLGEIRLPDNLYRSPCAVRYLANGTLDTTFGVNGVATFNTTDPNSGYQISDALLETDGKIVMAVSQRTSDGDYNFCIARFSANGSVDTGFGNNGLLVTDFGGDSYPNCVKKIDNWYYLFGTSGLDDENVQIAISRYNSFGALDQAFGNNGKVLLNRASSSNQDAIYYADVVDNKILAVGYGGTGSGDSFDLEGLIIRLNFDGSIDTSFNEVGYKLVNAPNTIFESYTSFFTDDSGNLTAGGLAYEVIDDSYFQGTLVNRFDLSNLTVNTTIGREFAVTPNPFSNKIQIKSSIADIVIENAELFDISGRKIKDLNANFPTEMKDEVFEINNLDGLPKGIYFLKIDTNYGVQYSKILKD